MKHHENGESRESGLRDPLTVIRMEFLEMPDMKLTLTQARRLFALPIEECEAALESLVSAGFLSRSRDGAFLRRTGHAAGIA